MHESERNYLLVPVEVEKLDHLVGTTRVVAGSQNEGPVSLFTLKPLTLQK